MQHLFYATALAAGMVACGKTAPDAPSPGGVTSQPRDSGAMPAGDSPTLDAGGSVGDDACSGGSCEACPPPRPSSSCGRGKTWSRDLDTGACCEYANECEAPRGVPNFSSEEACQTSCRCAEVIPDDFSQSETTGEVTFGTEIISLECFCADARCPANISDLGDELCSASNGTSRWVGCGKVAIRSDGGYTGGDWVFDAMTGALIGSVTFSDTTNGPCRTYNTIAGRAFDCEEAIECPLCGDAGTLLSDCN